LTLSMTANSIIQLDFQYGIYACIIVGVSKDGSLRPTITNT